MLTQQVVAVRQGFLEAHTISLGGQAGLSVYVSSAIDEDDEWYNPVREFLDSHRHELLFREAVDDESMMFGESVHSVYMMKEGSE